MTVNKLLLCFAVGIALTVVRPPGAQSQSNPVLEVKLHKFEVKDVIMRDGIAELSRKTTDGLHLGFEEIIRDRIQDDPRALNAHFSIQLQEKTVRQIIDALCESDPRYMWAWDGKTVNVYPRASKDDPSYLPALWIRHIAVNAIPDPDQGLTPLARIFPQQQIGYMGAGGEDIYPRPLTAVFEGVTVRQFINRIAERMAARTTWVWQGGKDERMFTFMKGGFSTIHPGN